MFNNASGVQLGCTLVPPTAYTLTWSRVKVQTRKCFWACATSQQLHSSKMCMKFQHLCLNWMLLKQRYSLHSLLPVALSMALSVTLQPNLPVLQPLIRSCFSMALSVTLQPSLPMLQSLIRSCLPMALSVVLQPRLPMLHTLSTASSPVSLPPSSQPL